MITIELRNHIGKQEVAGLGYVDVELDQWIVLAKNPDDGEKMQFVGYLPKRKGGPFLPCIPFVDMPKSVQDQIIKGINDELGEVRPLGIVPLSPSMVDAFENQLAGMEEYEDDEE